MPGEGAGSRAPPSASPKHREFLAEVLVGDGGPERGRHLGHDDHCLGPAGPSARVAASAITSASLLAAVPSAHRPARFVCATTTASSLVAEGAAKRRKRAGNPAKTPASSRRVPRVLRVHKNLPPFSAQHRVPILPSLRIILIHPALSSIPPCHDASGLELALSHRRKAPESSFWRGRKTRKALFSQLPTTKLPDPSLAAHSQRTISERRPCIFNLASICLHPAGSVAASRADNERYSGSGALPKATSMHSRAYFNAWQIACLINVITSPTPTPTFTTIASVGNKKEKLSLFPPPLKYIS